MSMGVSLYSGLLWRNGGSVSDHGNGEKTSEHSNSETAPKSQL